MSETLENGQVVLTLEEAIERLPDKEHIHTFLNPAFGLVGADWDRDQVIALLTKASKRKDKRKQIQETGDAAQAMGHGLAVFEARGPVFIEARGPK